MATEQDRWRGHPVLAALLRAVIVIVPLAAGYGASMLGLHLLNAQLRQTRWWLVVILAASVAVCFGVQRITRRFLPLAALLKLSMLFPDQAPNRFKLARGAASSRSLNQRVANARNRDAAAVAESVLALITALTAHDRRTRGHCERVRVFAELLGEELHLPREARDKLRWASLLHDIGKLRVAPEILNKPAKLSRNEWDLVAQHPVQGEELLGPLIEWLGEWGGAVRQHHEKYDGTGYPDQLAGSAIGRAARIVAITDSYEVMTAQRAYKKPMATVTARAELARCAGTQFDPVYVRAFLSISLPRLLWAMGPGSLLMNLPMLRVLAETTNKGLIAIPQSAVAAAGAAAVITSVVTTVHPGATMPTSAPVAQIRPLASGAHASPSPHASVRGAGRTNSAGALAPGATSTTGATPGATQTDPIEAAGDIGPGGTSSPTGPTSTDGAPANSGNPVDPGATVDPGGTADPTATTSAAAPTTGAAAPTTTAAAPTTTSAAPATTTVAGPSMAAPTLLSEPPASGLLPTVTFSWVALAGLTYEYQLDSGGWTSLGTSSSKTLVVLLGTHQFRLRGRATAGGGTTAAVAYTFTVIL